VSFEDKKFGLLTILKAVDENDEWIPYSRYADRYWCLCKCGNELVIWRSLLANNVQLDCGFCRRLKAYTTPLGNKAQALRKTSKHGHTRNIVWGGKYIGRRASGEWNSWSTMIARCHSKKHHAYENYGGRGIRVCARWREPRGQGFLNFITDLGPRPWAKTLDRINPQGHYEPTNCRWADAKTQTHNQRRFVFKHTKVPPVEKIREMERRIEEEFEPPY
jgi:hypothetical protein